MRLLFCQVVVETVQQDYARKRGKLNSRASMLSQGIRKESVVVAAKTVESRASWAGWINVVVASAIMLTTLPGRTQGLGLITEPMLRDLQLDRVVYANINLWATLIGAAICLPIGRLFDRVGLRIVTLALTALLS